MSIDMEKMGCRIVAPIQADPAGAERERVARFHLREVVLRVEIEDDFQPVGCLVLPETFAREYDNLDEVLSRDTNGDIISWQRPPPSPRKRSL
jgi:hypothetical protein